MLTLADFLRASIWAQTLTAEQLARVEAEMTERLIPAGGYACRTGEPVDTWVGVIQGLLKLQILSPAGKSMTGAGVPSGSWFGEGSLLKTEPRKYDAVALRDSRVAYMPRATFSWLHETSLGFNRFLVLQLNERLAQFIGMLEYDRLLGPEGRVARCIAMLYNPHLYPGFGKNLAISQEEIGFLSGFSRQRVNQVLHVLEKAGLLRIEYGGITVLNLEGLRGFGA